MKKNVWISWIVALMCAASASAYYEDFEDAGSLGGTLSDLDGPLGPNLGGATVNGGYLNGDYMGNGFLVDGDFPDFSATVTFNFGGDSYSWNVVCYTFGSNGSSSGYAGGMSGVMIWYLPNGGSTFPNGWMYILQEHDDPEAAWSTIYLDQSGAVNPSGGYDNTRDYNLQIVDNDDGTITTWVEETGNPANKGKVYDIDISGATLYGDRVYLTGDYTAGLGGIDRVVIGSVVPIEVTHTSGQTLVAEKNETTDTFNVVLEQQPSDTVTVTLDPQTADVELGMLGLGWAGPNNPVTLTFGTADWDTPQTVTVKAEDDAEAEGQETVTITLSSASADTAFVGEAGISVTVSDDDQYAVLIEESDGSTDITEGGIATDDYEIVLLIQPEADVTITINDTSEPNQVLVNGGNTATLTFTAANWDIPQTVTVEAIDDTDAEAHPHNATLAHTATQTGGNQNYDGIAIENVGVEIGENDCGAGPFDATDYNQDCITDLVDFAEMAATFLNCSLVLCL